MKNEPRTLQFGLSHLLLAIVVLSVLSALLFSSPTWVAAVTAMITSVLVPTLLISAIVYGLGSVRAFCVGALIPSTLAMVTTYCWFVVIVFDSEEGRFENLYYVLDRAGGALRMSLLLAYPFMPVCGALALWIYKKKTPKGMIED